MAQLAGMLSLVTAKLNGIKVDQSSLTKQINSNLAVDLAQAHAQAAQLEAQIAAAPALKAEGQLKADQGELGLSIKQLAREEMAKSRAQTTTLQDRLDHAKAQSGKLAGKVPSFKRFPQLISLISAPSERAAPAEPWLDRRDVHRRRRPRNEGPGRGKQARHHNQSVAEYHRRVLAGRGDQEEAQQ